MVSSSWGLARVQNRNEQISTRGASPCLLFDFSDSTINQRFAFIDFALGEPPHVDTPRLNHEHLVTRWVEQQRSTHWDGLLVLLKRLDNLINLSTCTACSMMVVWLIIVESPHAVFRGHTHATEIRQLHKKNAMSGMVDAAKCQMSAMQPKETMARMVARGPMMGQPWSRCTACGHGVDE